MGRLFSPKGGGSQMIGKPEVLAALSEMLREELGAINQYMLHAEMCENWGYKRLGDFVKKQSIGEMKHAEKLMERILFLEGTPRMDEMIKLKIGKNVPQHPQFHLPLEKSALAPPTPPPETLPATPRTPPPPAPPTHPNTTQHTP